MMQAIEIREAANGSSILTARFPYMALATIHDGGREGGRPRKERFKAGAFSHSIKSQEQEINLLVGHDFNRPLASKMNGTLQFDDTPAALELEATILPAIKQSSWWNDFHAGFASGLMTGISPGFRLPPKTAVAVAELFEDEPSAMGRAIIRTIVAAILFEISLVTRPAYKETAVSIRDYVPPPSQEELDKIENDPHAMPNRYRSAIQRWR